MLTKTTFVLTLLSLFLTLKVRATDTVPEPVDTTVTQETKALLLNIHRIGWDPDKIAFGQEFPLSYSRSMEGITDPRTSDIKDVVGDHPGVHGLDFHYFIDKDPHEREAHKEAARAAYKAGALVTFDYHWMGKYGGTHNWHERDAEILYNVVHGNDSEGDVTWFYNGLDKVLQMVNEELQFPIVFRPFHEMNGNWFWWGSRLKGGEATYREAYRILVKYISERSEHVLFCWSPDKALATDYYPGDAYVDIIGIDGYGAGNPRVHWFTVEDMVSVLGEAVRFAQKRGKVAAFTETGYDTTRNIDYHEAQPDWWMRSILEPILEDSDARRIAWILTWINADWSGPYVPYRCSPEPSKQAFQTFHDHPVTLFLEDISGENIYQMPPAAK